MRVAAERISYLHEREIEKMMKDIRYRFRPDQPEQADLVRRAITMVRRGAISSYRYSQDDGEVLAQLNDRASEFVRFSFGDQALSCTCGTKDRCEHQLAVVFDLYSQFNSLTEWYQDWRTSEKEELAVKITERTPDAWDAALANVTAPLRKLTPAVNSSVFTYECAEIENRVRPLMPFEYEWKPLFDLYYRLHLLDAAWAYISDVLDAGHSQHAYGTWQVTTWLNDQIADIERLAGTFGSKPKLFETDPFMNRLKTLVYSVCVRHSGQFAYRFRIYEAVWGQLFSGRDEREEEKRRLAEDGSEEAKLLSMYFAIIEGRGDILEGALSAEQAPDFGSWMMLAKFARESALMPTAGAIARGLYPSVGSYFSRQTSRSEQLAAAQQIDALLDSGDFTDEEYETVYSMYGKIGISRYSRFLAERERYMEWAALLHRFAVPFDSVDAEEMKEVLAHQPDAAMPLLHDYAQQFIADKNRMSYRRAVKLFKRMRTACKRSGRNDFWNRYIRSVREKHRRLRALVEEMERGNLEL
ncbi:hypothetical protein [Sporosarcina koreensis]|uniref:hypothetical protein n=1 Tax=Sporosarcina koreensis TaxID=334735 RepID=UPI00058D1DEE|nr:hypothetical protein [Sporosarcina koreensis]